MAVIIDQSNGGSIVMPPPQFTESDIMNIVRNGGLTLADIQDSPEFQRYALNAVGFSGGPLGFNGTAMPYGANQAIEPMANNSLIHSCGAGNDIQIGYCTDGNRVTFPTPFASGLTPIVGFIGGGMSYASSGITGSQFPNFQALSISNTGFTPSLKLQSASGTQTPQSVNFSPYNTHTSEIIATLTGTDVNNNYTLNFGVSFSGGEPGTLTVYAATDGVTYVQEWQKTIFKSVSYALVLSVSGMANGSTFKIDVSNCTVSGTTVTWNSASSPTQVSATPSGAVPVMYLAYPPTG